MSPRRFDAPARRNVEKSAALTWVKAPLRGRALALFEKLSEETRDVVWSDRCFDRDRWCVLGVCSRLGAATRNTTRPRSSSPYSSVRQGGPCVGSNCG